jgi:hypothetical protein
VANFINQFLIRACVQGSISSTRGAQKRKKDSKVVNLFTLLGSVYANVVRKYVGEILLNIFGYKCLRRLINRDFFDLCFVTILPNPGNNKKNENFPSCAENVGVTNSDFFSYTKNWQKSSS